MIFFIPRKLCILEKKSFFLFFRFFLSLFCPAPLYRPYRPGPVKWPKVGQNGSKIEEKTIFEIPEENLHILIPSSTFFIFGDFLVNFQIFSKSFLSSSFHKPYRPSPVKWPRVGQNTSKIQKKCVSMNRQEILHIWKKI